MQVLKSAYVAIAQSKCCELTVTDCICWLELQQHHVFDIDIADKSDGIVEFCPLIETWWCRVTLTTWM